MSKKEGFFMLCSLKLGQGQLSRAHELMEEQSSWSSQVQGGWDGATEKSQLCSFMAQGHSGA